MKALLILATMVVSLFGFAGGGGSSSGGGGSSGGSSYSSGSHHSSNGDGSGEFTWGGFLFMLAFGGVIVAVAVIASRKEQQKFNAMDQNNTEQEKWIHGEAERIFAQYQQDWSDYNLDGIKKYTTERYFQHASLMLEAIDQMKRRNVVSDLAIERAVLFTPVNNETTMPVTVRLAFVFGGTDSLVKTDTKEVIFSNKAYKIKEYWDFVYDGKALWLDGITQSTESTPHLISDIADFAREDNLFYSPDWGRLALPTKGLIFGNDTILSSADVNNHVVGKWKECLVQIYTYSQTPTDPGSYYIVGQINVPKVYEGVIVEAENAQLRIKVPRDYDKYEMEWGEFSQRYKVFAASRDALPAFELLNPAFMERLYERNLPYNLEVKDNTIYIFAKVSKAKKEDYAELLDVLAEAFNELKM